MIKYFTKIFLCLLLTCFFSVANAQDVSIRYFPESPKEGDEVKVTISSDKYDLGKSEITWSVDNVEVDKGIGRKTHTLKVTADKPNQFVSVVVKQEGFYDGSADTIVSMTSDFILYEGEDSYTPPFYKGRALPAKEGRARVGIFSFKDGEITGFSGGEAAEYVWKIDGQEKVDLGGNNKILNVLNTRVVDTSLNINIAKKSGERTNTVSETVSLVNTDVVVKRWDEKKLLTSPLNEVERGKQIFLTVEPYFFSVDSRQSNLLNYVWKINNLLSAIATPWSVVFSGTVNESVKINLDLSHKQKLTQEKSQGFTFKVE